MLKKILTFLLIISSCVTVACSDPNYNEDYERGYKKGVDTGYSEGFNDALSQDDSSVDYVTEHEYWMFENMYDYGIITLSYILEDIEENDAKKIISILSNYYYDIGIYGDFVGEYPEYLLHATDGPCFQNIPWDNMVLFDSNIPYVLSKNVYQLCPICYQENSENFEHVIYGYDFESTWGDLIDANGGELVYETLTPEQQALVNYPYFDKENVYFIPNGNNYHSVDWCYTLENSEKILNCTLQDALNKRLNPCSKCIEE